MHRFYFQIMFKMHGIQNNNNINDYLDNYLHKHLLKIWFRFLNLIEKKIFLYNYDIPLNINLNKNHEKMTKNML